MVTSGGFIVLESVIDQYLQLSTDDTARAST